MNKELRGFQVSLYLPFIGFRQNGHLLQAEDTMLNLGSNAYRAKSR
jgi:hypothetical protein